MLRHVRGEEPVRERIERGVARNHDHEQSAVERRLAQPSLEPRRATLPAAASEPVEERHGRHEEERRLDRPGGGARQARHGVTTDRGRPT